MCLCGAFACLGGAGALLGGQGGVLAVGVGRRGGSAGSAGVGEAARPERLGEQAQGEEELEVLAGAEGEEGDSRGVGHAGLAADEVGVEGEEGAKGGVPVGEAGLGRRDLVAGQQVERGAQVGSAPGFEELGQAAHPAQGLLEAPLPHERGDPHLAADGPVLGPQQAEQAGVRGDGFLEAALAEARRGQALRHPHPRGGRQVAVPLAPQRVDGARRVRMPRGGRQRLAPQQGLADGRLRLRRGRTGERVEPHQPRLGLGVRAGLLDPEEEQFLGDGGAGAELVEGRDDLCGLEALGGRLHPLFEGGDAALDFLDLCLRGGRVLVGQRAFELASEVERELEADEGEDEPGENDGEDSDQDDAPHGEVDGLR